MSSTHNIDFFFFLLRMFLSSFCCGKLCKFLLKYLLVKENPFFLIETISNNYIIPVTNKMLHIGVHTELENPTNSSDPPETEPQPLELTNPTVGDGSPTIEPDTFGSVSGFPPQKLEPPDPTIKSTKSGNIQMFSNKFTNTGDIFAFPTKSYLKSTRSSKISSRSSPDSMDPAKYQPDLDRSVKISAPAAKPKTNWHKPKTQRTRTGRSDHYYMSVLVLFFTHSKYLDQALVEHKPGPVQLMHTPRPPYDFSSIFFFYKLCKF